ncbi:uncharacterized protein DNG_10014 [Cephalotrichum gorgonifer]|uniref:Uncharacterized protein n=1 Tax=Cephalotrichum gorgonifer TaxID=2041049 RepID=A0AAE8SZY3_9PEZI|nr:uncharacterized protein DNG_10014 [Cephalotrichum gorgonifer]
MPDPQTNGPTDKDSQSQYVEFDPNTAPQVSIGTDPEVFAPIEPDVAYQRPGDGPSQGAVEEKGAGPGGIWTKVRNIKRKVLLGIALGVAVCVILAIGISLPLVGDKAGRSTETRSSGIFPTLSASLTDSTTSNIPTATGAHGCEQDKFKPSVDWVGIRDGIGWDFDLKAAGSAEKCCGYCYKTANECNAWLYVPQKSPIPDCTLILGYNGEDADGDCPNGRPDIIFNEVDNRPESIGGVGPCSGS